MDRSLGGYSPWGCKESDTTEATYLVSYLRGGTSGIRKRLHQDGKKALTC